MPRIRGETGAVPLSSNWFNSEAARFLLCISPGVELMVRGSTGAMCDAEFVFSLALWGSILESQLPGFAAMDRSSALGDVVERFTYRGEPKISDERSKFLRS
jgi:hypothetical protein